MLPTTFSGNQKQPLIRIFTLPEANSSHLKRWLEDECPFGDSLFSGALDVSFREGTVPT